MFLFKKIKYLILSLVAFITIGVGVGVSYWVFAKEGFNNAINSDSNIDNIYENYTFGKESITDKYDIYFFPSTYYLYRFASKVKDVNGKEPSPNSEPEKIYGYLDYDHETKKFAIVGGDEGDATNTQASANKYHIDINGLTYDNKAYSDLDKFTNDSDNDLGGGRKNYSETLGTYLSIDRYNGGNQSNYAGYIETAEAITDVWHGKFGGEHEKTKTVINVNYLGGGSKDENNALGSLDADLEDKSTVTLIQNGTNLLTKGDIYDKYNQLEKSDPFNQRLEIDDRLGY